MPKSPHHINAPSHQRKKGAIIIEGHVQGLSNTRALGEDGIPVIVVDTGNCVAKHSKYCRAFFKSPPYDSDKLADFLIELAKEHELKDWLLLPSNDHAVLTLSRNKSRLEEYFKVITPALDIIENIYDKGRLLEVAEKAGVPIPKTFYVSDSRPEDIDLNFPVITKGRQGLDFKRTTGRKAFIAESPEELHEQLTQIGKVFPVGNTFTQELIPDDGTNKTVSFCAFCENGKTKTCWMGEKLREHPVRFGTATFARSVYLEECYRLSIPLLEALNYTGVCEVEYLRDPRDGRYKLIEINARTWLWVELARACGVNYARIIYNYVYGLSNYYPDTYDTCRYWINPFTDTAYALPAILKGHLKISQYASSLVNGKKVNALYSRDDPKPAMAYFMNLFSFLRNR